MSKKGGNRVRYDFDTPLNKNGISTLKWDEEIIRSGDPDLICCGTADLDFKSPGPVLEAIRRTAERGHLGYPRIKEEYYQVIEEWLYKLAGWKIDAHTQVFNNLDIYIAVWMLIDALSEPGDEIIIQPPVHFCFEQIIRDNNRKPVINPLRYDGTRYTMDFEQLEQCFSEKTKLFWLCNPHNPVGRTWTREELKKLGEICINHNVRIISDDVYCGLLYPGIRYTPISSISPEIARNSVICYSASKIYNTMAIKHSFIVTQNPEIMERYIFSCRKMGIDYGMNLIGMEVTMAAFSQCDSWVAQLMEYVSGNYAMLENAVSKELKG